MQPPCGSGLARDPVNAIQQENRVARIAGKPAPTRARHCGLKLKTNYLRNLFLVSQSRCV